MSEEDDARNPFEMGVGRLEAFSDAVMAVIMTLMALELRVPSEGSSAREAWLEVRPGLLVYILSFLFIAIYWNNHHHLLRATRRISSGVMWANMFLLFWLSLIPVCTSWVREDGGEAVPAAAYGIVMLACGLAYTLLVRAIIRANGTDSAVARAIASDVKGYVSLVLYASGVLLASVSPWISYALYLSVSVMWLIPDRRFTRATPSPSG